MAGLKGSPADKWMQFLSIFPEGRLQPAAPTAQEQRDSQSGNVSPHPRTETPISATRLRLSQIPNEPNPSSIYPFIRIPEKNCRISDSGFPVANDYSEMI
jgi:hypothetical protein